MTDKPNNVITMYEWERPNGDKQLREVIVTPEAKEVHDAALLAGFVYSYEFISVNTVILYISDDNIEHDVVTCVIVMEPNNGPANSGKLSRNIEEHPLAKLVQLRDEYIEAEKEAGHDV